MQYTGRMSKQEIEAYELAEMLSSDRPSWLVVAGKVDGEWRVMWHGWKKIMEPKYYFKNGELVGEMLNYES